MHIEIIIDTVCPWCFIGLKRLKDALIERPQLRPTISYKPFLLDPTIPQGGIPKAKYILEKFRSNQHYENSINLVNEIGEQEGLDLKLDMIKIIPNSLNSHCLVILGETIGKDHEILEEIMRAYFCYGYDITNDEILCKIGKKYNLKEEAIMNYINNEKYKKLLHKETMRLRNQGINGVPTYILNNSYAISGAQDKVALLKIIDLASAENSNSNLQSFI
tara:strand:+ start:460 stop:1116 length:657 start_codon:yes stop_codon:yes gene_type:complete